MTDQEKEQERFAGGFVRGKVEWGLFPGLKSGLQGVDQQEFLHPGGAPLRGPLGSLQLPQPVQNHPGEEDPEKSGAGALGKAGGRVEKPSPDDG